MKFPGASKLPWKWCICISTEDWCISAEDCHKDKDKEWFETICMTANSTDVFSISPKYLSFVFQCLVSSILMVNVLKYYTTCIKSIKELKQFHLSIISTWSWSVQADIVFLDSMSMLLFLRISPSSSSPDRMMPPRRIKNDPYRTEIECSK